MSIFNFWKPKQKPFECQPKKDDAFDDANLIYKTVTGIVGMKYRKKNARKALNLLELNDGETDDVELMREPTNPHDHLAIKVYLFGIFVGYIPRREMRELRRIIQKENIIIKATAMVGFPIDENEFDFALFIKIYSK